MINQKVNLKTDNKLQEIILREKAKGTPDLEIGQKYGVTFRYIERLITKSQGINISALKVAKRIKTLYPKDFNEEHTAVWSFKQRGNWATHSGEYRGNWSPYIPRNVILKYSKPGELVLDYFCGAGTTAVEAKLLGRRCKAFDINEKAIHLAKKNIDFVILSQKPNQIYKPELSVSDARDLSSLKSNSVDLICAHPPYANIIHYTDSNIGDLSFLDIEEFLKEMFKVAQESFRVLKPGRQCAVLIGDTRRRKHVIPLGFKLINVYLDAGFKLRELVIKRQHNCKTTGFWHDNSIKYNFLLLAHEYLPIFEKPKLHYSSHIKERIEYNSVMPTLEKSPLKKRLNELETTTVWVLPKNDFEEYLNKNVIDRYSNKNGYSTITFSSCSKKADYFNNKEKNKKGLLFIKASFLSNNPSQSDIKFYLQRTKEVINQDINRITVGGFIVIQTRDVRINGYVEPMAKRIVDMLSNDNLWLKEIIVATYDGSNSNTLISKDYLNITHQYLLVYEVIK